MNESLVNKLWLLTLLVLLPVLLTRGVPYGSKDQNLHVDEFASIRKNKSLSIKWSFNGGQRVNINGVAYNPSSHKGPIVVDSHFNHSLDISLPDGSHFDSGSGSGAGSASGSASDCKPCDPSGPCPVTTTTTTPIPLTYSTMGSTVGPTYGPDYSSSTGHPDGSGSTTTDSYSSTGFASSTTLAYGSSTTSKPPLEITPVITPPITPTTETGKRRQAIVDMMQIAWKTYTDPAYLGTRDRVTPIDASQSVVVTPGRNLVAMMSSLWVIGAYAEFNEAKQLLESSFSCDETSQRLNVDLYGSLISCFSMTGDKSFLAKAKECADKLATFQASSNASNIGNDFYAWSNHRLEFQYMSDLAQNGSYLEKLAPIEATFNATGFDSLLYFTKGQNVMMKLKSALQINSPTLLSDYFQSVNQLLSSGAIQKSGPLAYGINTKTNKNSDFGYCIYGAMLLLGSKQATAAADTSAKEVQESLARRVTETCHLALGLASNRIPYGEFVVQGGQIKAPGQGDMRYLSRIAESYFVLHRLTGEEVFANYAWQLASAIRHNWFGNNYYSLQKSGYSAEMLSGTLKYLYLTFSPKELLPLDQWVFDGAGHPLPICGKNSAYPKCKTDASMKSLDMKSLYMLYKLIKQHL